MRFSLAQVKGTTGRVVVDIFELTGTNKALDDSVRGPVHSLDVAFSVNGQQELRYTKTTLSLN